MGKFKENNTQEANQSIQSDSRTNNHRDGFFLKPKISKEIKPFQNRQVKKDNVNNPPSGNISNSDMKDEKTKKPFDKKQWRVKKYSNKYKVDQWKEMRKKKIVNQYHRFTKKKDEKAVDVQKIYEKYGEENSDSDDGIDSKGMTSLGNVKSNGVEISNQSRSPVKEGRKNTKIHDKILKMKEEKLKKKEEFLQKKAEREEALKLSRQKKAERYRRLNKRTKKGQPIMKDRMEMLYEQVQKICQE